MAAKVQGFIFRSPNRIRLQQFYLSLGINFTEHRHGGPMHSQYQEDIESFVLEIYNASDKFPSDALMVNVDSLDDSVAAAVSAGGRVLHPAMIQNNFRFAYVADPDNRPVLLAERIK